MSGLAGVPSPVLVVLMALIGAAVGSFLALLADRLPRSEDVVSRPSHCESCGRNLSWRDKLPLVSWVWLRGRCRHCGAVIPLRLFLAEGAGALLGLGAFAVVVRHASDPSMMLWQVLAVAIFLWALLGLALCDLAAWRLPDALTLLLLLAGVAMAVLDPARGLADALIGAGAGAGAFWLLRMGYLVLRGREGLGLGDVKLMGGIGAGVGIAALPLVVLVAALAALAVALLGGLRRGHRPAGDTAMPFGAFLSVSAAILLLLGAV